MQTVLFGPRSQRIYIAGPLSAPTEEERQANCDAAIDAALYLMRKGHAPFVPHLNHMVTQRRPDALTYDDFMEWDYQYLALCDSMLFLHASPGACRELERAARLGKYVYWSVTEVPDAT